MKRYRKRFAFLFVLGMIVILSACSVEKQSGGATDGAYIEILSGVEEGDVVSSVPPNLDPRSNS